MLRRGLQNHTATLHFAGDHDCLGNVSFHVHPCPELILVVKGTCQTDTPVGSLTSDVGDLLLMPAGLSHNQIDHGPVRSLYAGVVTDQLNVVEPYLFRPSCFEMVSQCMSMLVQLHTRQWSVSQNAGGHLLQMILDQVTGQLRPAQKHGQDRRLLSLRQWVEDHLHHVITVESMADQAGVSVSRLFQLFGEQMQLSPMQYVLAQRMQRARQYLKDPYLSVKQIAPRCGYQDVNLFVRTFRLQHGLPPRRWRITSIV